MSKMSELRNLADEELETRLAETKAELFNFRFQNVTGQLANYTRLSQVKRRHCPDDDPPSPTGDRGGRIGPSS